MRKCFQCGAEIASRERVPFKELCPKCDAFLHCCRNCRLYSPDAHNHCLSSTNELVPDVERGNYCDEFAFRETEPDKPKAARGGGKKAAAEFEPERTSGSVGQTAREKFEGLFKD